MPAMTIESHRSTGAIGHDLERARLEHRARRIGLVLAALRDRRRARGAVVAAPLDQAIAGFERELAAVRTRLARLSIHDRES